MKKVAFIISILTSFYSLGQKKSDKIDNDLNYNIQWAEYFFENRTISDSCKGSFNLASIKLNLSIISSSFSLRSIT